MLRIQNLKQDRSGDTGYNDQQNDCCKYSAPIIPTDSPFCATIKATSPLVIIPTPIFNASGPLNLQILAIRPQPMILHSNATTTNPIEKSTNSPFRWSKLVFNPILAKKIGPKII